MQFTELALPGCFEIMPTRHSDVRGSFVKVFHRDEFSQRGLVGEWPEEYYSVSAPGVVRGLHFQVPPQDHAKLVYCVAGEVLDGLVDVRIGSPTYGRHLALALSAEKANLVYLPSGIAHGFAVRAGSATLVYRTSTVHSPSCDSGIRWDSAGIPWGIDTAIVSPRDAQLPALADFRSPFTYRKQP
ncbi:MAG: dTDP-4-dehydrorhamnose 3,5-epimerase family protein [Planctomycetes bacterium]|nr:dTDP-4-dehydrorhamnose 3,5-epimerase family protein [Planctomycetota bacterium]